MSQIAIIGLGLIGTSIGLALKREERSYTIMGHDKDGDAIQHAKTLGAIDTSHWNLISACEAADLIILAIPSSEIRPTLEAIRQELKSGCLITDTAPLKLPVLKAAEILPDSVHFVGGNPILATGRNLPEAEASADLFLNASWALCPTATTNEDAIRVTADLVTVLGAQPLFLDPVEHDGLMAAADGLPSLMAAALVNVVSANPAWREIRRMAGRQFEFVSFQPDLTPADLSTALMSNRQNIIHWVDSVIEELRAWKEELQVEDTDALERRYERATDSRTQWMRMRERGDWERQDRPEDTPSFWRRMFGISERKASESP